MKKLASADIATHALILLLALALLPGCSTLNDWGIGGAPKMTCAQGKAQINDRIAGSDRVSLAMIRQFEDGNALCPKP